MYLYLKATYDPLTIHCDLFANTRTHVGTLNVHSDVHYESLADDHGGGGDYPDHHGSNVPEQKVFTYETYPPCHH